MSLPHRLTRLPLLCVILVELTLVSGCREHGLIPATAIRHPTPENLPPEGGPMIRGDTVVSGLSPERTAEWAATRRALLGATAVTSIGAMGGSGPDVLGVVESAASDDDGNIYLSDATTEEVLIFDATGSFRQRLGGKGGGPEEFQDIRDFVLLPDGRLVVGQGGSRAKVLAPGADGYEFAGPLVTLRSARVMVANDICNLGSRIFVHSTNLVDGDLVLHEVAADDGSVLASFGEAYRSEFARDREMRSYGSIACGEHPVANVMWGHYYFPIVKAYRPDNTLLWTALIEDFVQGPVYQNNASTPTVHPRGISTEYVVGLHALRPGFAVLQTTLHLRPDDPEKLRDWNYWQVTRRRTYLLDQATGHGALVGDSLPRIAWIGDSRFIVTWSDPYPKLEVRAMAVPTG